MPSPPTPRFNLIDEPWIPVVDKGRVSLKDIFTNPHLRALGGNPVQKIAVLKLLLAIAQSAKTPETTKAWRTLGAEGLSAACCDYLDKWHDAFYLFGDRPFLQMPAIAKAAIQPFGAVLPEIATGNTTVHTDLQQAQPLNDADKAMLVVQLMGFALGGKKTDNAAVLSKTYRGKTKENGKPTTGKAGSALGFMGFLHNFLHGENAQQTLWLNLFTDADIKGMREFEAGLGTPPWEAMPQTEDDAAAKQLKTSLIGRLIPMGRFVLLTDEGLHYSEGIHHFNYLDARMNDPSVSVNYAAKKPKVIWTDPEKRPWRSLTALLSCTQNTIKDPYTCLHLKLGMKRARNNGIDIALWSGGLKVSSNAGEQYMAGSDDYVESLIKFANADFGEDWFKLLKQEASELEWLASKVLYGSVMAYCKEQTMEGKSQAAQATNLFWQLCEPTFSELLTDIESAEYRARMRKLFARHVRTCYDWACPKDTARQLSAWAKAQPNLSKYLSQDDNDAKDDKSDNNNPATNDTDIPT